MAAIVDEEYDGDCIDQVRAALERERVSARAPSSDPSVSVRAWRPSTDDGNRAALYQEYASMGNQPSPKPQSANTRATWNVHSQIDTSIRGELDPFADRYIHPRVLTSIRGELDPCADRYILSRIVTLIHRSLYQLTDLYIHSRIDTSIPG